MEAGYDTLEEEDYRTELIGEMEDQDELANIKADQVEERIFRQNRLQKIQEMKKYNNERY